MNKDQRLLEEAYQTVLENEEQPFELTSKEEQMVKELVEEIRQIVQHYKQMFVETINIAVSHRTPPHISYPKDSHKTILVYFRAKLLLAVEKVVKARFPDSKMFNIMYSICTMPFAQMSFYVDENDDLRISLNTVDTLLHMVQPTVFDEDKLTRRLPKIFTDWIEYKLKQHFRSLDDYMNERKTELRDKKLDKELSSDFDTDVLRDF